MDVEQRLKEIETRLSLIEKQIKPSPLKQVMVASKIDSTPPLPSTTLQIDPQKPSLDTKWLKNNWLIIIGLILVTAASGWFVSYAFVNNLIDETTRVILGLSIGILIYASGLWLLKSSSLASQTLTILGQIISITSLFAAHQFYDLLSPTYAFVGMLVFVVPTITLATIKNLEGLGGCSILMAFLIPILTKTDSPNYNLLLSYILLLDIVAFFTFVVRNWGKAFHLAWLATIAYTFLHSMHYENVPSGFVAIFYLTFFLTTILSMTGKINHRLPFDGSSILISTTLLFIFWVESMTPYSLKIGFYLSATILSFVFGYQLSKNWNNHFKESLGKRILAFTLSFNVMTFIFILTNKLVVLNFQPIFYLTEVTLCIAIGYYILKAPAVIIGLPLYFLLPLLQIVNQHVTPYGAFFSIDFATLCVATLAFVVSAWIIHQTRAKLISNLSLNFISTSLTVEFLIGMISGIFIMNLVWNICYNLVSNENIARGITLVLYILAAEFLIYIAHLKQLKVARLIAFALILFVILRLGFYEVLLMPIMIRTLTFIVIGLLLIGTAILDKIFKTTTNASLKT